MKSTWAVVAAVATLGLWACGGSGGSTSSSGTSSSSSTSGSGGSTGSSGSTGSTGSGSTSGSTGSSGSSGSSGTTGPWAEFPHTPFPRVPNVTNGPTLHHPQIVAITFDDYAYQSTVEGFLQWLVGSDWLATVGADYNVGLGAVYQTVHLSDAAPSSITDSQIQAYLSGLIDSGTLPAPGSAAAPLPPLDAGFADSDAGGSDAGAADGGSLLVDAGEPDAGPTGTDGGEPLTEPIYTIFYPANTQISFEGTQEQSCSSFGGYHSFFTYKGTPVSYAVLPTCEIGAETTPYLEVATSHEIIEASTDPFPWVGGPVDTTSYEIEDPNSAWSLLPGEVADLCVGTEYQDPSGYYLQRVWSNSAATRGTGSPCVPAANGPFVDVSTPQVIVQTASPGTVLTFPVTAWSSQPVGARWRVQMQLVQGTFFPQVKLQTSDGQIDTHFDGSGSVTMGDRDKAAITITIPANVPPSTDNNPQFFALTLDSETGTGEYEMWPVAVYVTH